MKRNRRSAGTLVGLLVAGSLLALAGAWIPAAQKSAEDCGCRTPGKAAGLPISQAEEWCLTQPVFESHMPIGRERPLTPELCTQYGPPDNPAVRDAAIPNAGTPWKTVRLMIHVLCERRGANPAASEADVVNAVDTLNARYAQWRIRFVYNWRFVNDSKYRYMDTGAEVNSMKLKYAQSPESQLNIFVTTFNPGGSWGTFPWDGWALTASGGIIIQPNHFVDATVPTHEVGHCLGLWHTFHGVDEVAACSDCYEQAGRTVNEGNLTGDKCSDTNPTSKNYACFDPISAIDACTGQHWVDTPWQNYMGYSIGCTSEFTPQQAGRMHAWIEDTLSGWLAPPPVPNAPGTPSLSTSGGTVTIAWADNSDDENGFEVQRETRANGRKWNSTTTVASVGANVTSATDTPGSGTFRYRVHAFNGSGYSAWSDWAQIDN